MIGVLLALILHLPAVEFTARASHGFAGIGKEIHVIIDGRDRGTPTQTNLMELSRKVLKIKQEEVEPLPPISDVMFLRNSTAQTQTLEWKLEPSCYMYMQLNTDGTLRITKCAIDNKKVTRIVIEDDDPYAVRIEWEAKP